MEKTIVAKLGSGMDSCVRVMNLLRTKGINSSYISIERDKMTIRVQEDFESRVLANLRTLADVSVL